MSELLSHCRFVKGKRAYQIPKAIDSKAVDYRILAPQVRYDHSGTADEVRTLLTKLGELSEGPLAPSFFAGSNLQKHCCAL